MTRKVTLQGHPQATPQRVDAKIPKKSTKANEISPVSPEVVRVSTQVTFVTTDGKRKNSNENQDKEQ